MKKRHLARAAAFQILYQQDILSQGGAVKMPESFLTTGSLEKHFTAFKVPEDLQPFASELARGASLQFAETDVFIEKYAENWKVSRLAVVDRNILRLAIYEMLHHPETPPSVVIDEALELAKQYGGAESSAFINGILDSVAKELAAAKKT